VRRAENSAAATVVSVLAVLGAMVAFCLFFTAFLLVPFFVFIAAGIALIISERNAKIAAEAPVEPAPEAAEVEQ
jgi:hypothetical protein